MIKDKSRLNFFDKFVLVLNYISGAGILISYLAPVTDPQNYWLIAFFGLAYPPLLLVNVLLVIYWLLRLKPQILISIFCIGVGYKILQKNIGFHKATENVAKTNADQIRILAYNVHSFTSPVGTNGSTRHGILQLIKEEQPDLVNIEEYHSVKKVKGTVGDSIKKIMETDYAYYQPFAGDMTIGTGLAIFSKFPIVNKGIIWLTKDETDTKSIYIDIKTNKDTIRVYCVHLQSFLLNSVDHTYMDSVSQQGSTNIRSSRRIGSKLKAGFIRRSDQVKIMRAEFSKCPYPYIVAGDFNDTPSSFAVNQMAAGLKNAFCEKGRGLGRTYNGDVPNYQIDYIMASKQFDVVNYRVIEQKLSDHYAVRSDLSLK